MRGRKPDALEESKNGGQGQLLERLSEVLEKPQGFLERACGLAVEENVMRCWKVQTGGIGTWIQVLTLLVHRDCPQTLWASHVTF